MNDITTANLSDFGHRELEMLEELLRAMREQGLPDDFCDDGVIPMMNRNSGFVFLTNSEFQTAMMNGDKLESFYFLAYAGNEGFASELYEEFQGGFIDHHDLEQLSSILGENGMPDKAEEVYASLAE